MSELTATLVIGITSSECGNCRKPTLIKPTHHVDISGWSPRRWAGCGARFVDTAPGHSFITDWHLKRARPDLPIRGKAQEDAQ